LRETQQKVRSIVSDQNGHSAPAVIELVDVSFGPLPFMEGKVKRGLSCSQKTGLLLQRQSCFEVLTGVSEIGCSQARTASSTVGLWLAFSRKSRAMTELTELTEDLPFSAPMVYF